MKIIVARDTPCVPPESCPAREKNPGSARFVFISRISPKKNLLYAIALMNGQPRASLDIYGPIEDATYWAECQSLISKYSLPVAYRGDLRWTQVIPTFQQYHFFLFPTMSENFGHVIFEALAAGCPPLLSNQTPWNDLMENECGWTTPVGMPEMWRRIMEICIAMSQVEYSECSQAAHAYAKRWIGTNIIDEYRRLFSCAAHSS